NGMGAEPSKAQNGQGNFRKLSVDEQKKVLCSAIQQEVSKYESNADLDKIKLPENIDSVYVIEKPMEDNKNTKTDPGTQSYVHVKKIVKKVINFKDGTSGTIFYQK